MSYIEVSFYVAKDDCPLPGCGDACDNEFVSACETCNQEHFHDAFSYFACMEEFFDSDCHDCLCDYISDKTGGAITCSSLGSS